LSIPPYVVLHEYMHAKTAELFGAKTRIVVDKYFGGSLLEKISNIDSADIFMKSGDIARCYWKGQLNNAEIGAVFFAPYMLTPFGIAAMMHGAKKKNSYITGIGMFVGLKPFIDVGYDSTYDLSRIGGSLYQQAADLIPILSDKPGEAVRIACMLGVMAGTYAIGKALVKGLSRIRKQFNA